MFSGRRPVNVQGLCLIVQSIAMQIRGTMALTPRYAFSRGCFPRHLTERGGAWALGPATVMWLFNIQRALHGQAGTDKSMCGQK